jgi:hypothetical protein
MGVGNNREELTLMTWSSKKETQTTINTKILFHLRLEQNICCFKKHKKKVKFITTYQPISRWKIYSFV